MKNLDLKWHKTKLLFIRNRFGIVYGIFLFLWTFSFVLGILLLGRINDVVNRIEDNQKAEACILQIARKDRTNKRISGCVDKNSSHPKQDFKFNSASNPPSGTPNSSVIPMSIPAPQPTIQVSKPTPRVASVTSKPKPKPATKTPRTFITRVNALGQRECRYIGFTAWVLEVNGVCP